MAEPYFLWKGIDSRDMGVVVNSYPPIVRPRERITERPIPGRPGTLHLSEGDHVFDTVARSCQCYIRPEMDINAVIAWLRGNGTVVFGNESAYAYTAWIDNQISLDIVLRGNAYRSFTIPFICQPFKTLATPTEDIEKTSSGQMINNPGTVESMPVIAVEGSGDIILTVGGFAVELTDISGGIRIDCTLPECFTLDRSALINEKMNGDFPTIPPGNSTVSWTGTVTKVTITPNWRWL